MVSTSHIDPLDQFQKLILQMQQPNTTSRYPKWFFPHLGNIYKYFVLLHDAQDGELAKAHSIYENLKNTFGSSNCHLLQINSKNVTTVNSAVSSAQPTTELDPWLQYCKFNDLVNGINQLNLNEDHVTNNNLNEEVNLTSTNDANDLNDPLTKKLSNENLANINITNNEAGLKKHGMCLALSDHDRIKTFIGEFLQRGLVPYAERTIKLLYEHIQSKKSILKSLSIPRRIFGGSSSSTSSSSMTKSTSLTPTVSVSASSLSSNNSNSSLTITNNFVTPNDEFQQRRLADLAFMFRLYDMAYTSYHSCKKEYSNFLSSNSTNAANNDQLLLTNFNLAGSLEMASVANFMQNMANDTTSSASLVGGSSRTYNSQYIDEAIQLYLNVCKNVYFATRATLLSTEALRLTNFFSKAAFQFVNLANDETDVRSALFLEQAALCYLAQPIPWIRKYAFFMSLAGHRFNKSGQVIIINILLLFPSFIFLLLFS